MKSIWKFIWAIILFITGVWLYRIWEEHRRKQRELEEQRRKTIYDIFVSNLPQLKEAIKEFNNLLNYETGYFTKYQLDVWKQRSTTVWKITNSESFDGIVNQKGIEILNTFNNYFANCERYREKFNIEFIPIEAKKYSALFDNIEKRRLDNQQRRAIITDEDNNIVIAGAGSGKTTTIVGKVQYVIDRYKVRPEEILLISFTNKSASTLSSRIRIDGVEAKTFHKFGKDVIATVDNKQPSIYDESQFRQFVVNTFNSLMADSSYLSKVTKYFSDFIKPERSQFDFDNQGDYIQFLKDHNFRPYHQIQPNGRQTFHREIVKSIEECKIANFLLFHNLNYEYESPYEFDTATSIYARWKPDFTIRQNDKTVYIEHFAINRNGDVPRFFVKKGETYEMARDRYLKKIEWARERCKSDGTILIETYSYEMFEDVLYENLKTNLELHGIVLKLKSPKEIWTIVSDAAKDDVTSFITLFQTFITLMKSNNYSTDDLSSRNAVLNQGFQARRNTLFLEIVEPIYRNYENHLSSRGEIDFSDMINKASSFIRSGDFDRKFSYIIVDEFQDISIGRYQLLKAIKDVNPSCKLFCVGDDWQSIYRFSGSDIALFKDFEKYFGYTAKSKIETTYRFHNPLLKLTSDFIQRNPNQAKKELKSTSTVKSTTYQIEYSISEPQNQDDTDALRGILDSLAKIEPSIESKEILLLGRYNHDIQRIKNNPPVFQIRHDADIPFLTYNARNGLTTNKIELQYLTVHKAKGLEADIVIVINCNSGKYGFPSEMSDDPILNLLLSEADQFENGEERRLFYVAMTRAKERLYLLADSSYKSKFINELEVGSGNHDVKKCPNCVTADLVKRSGTKNGKQWAFYGCTNSLYGCEYKEWLT